MGKKSGPLAFLNKKGWHPGNQRNQEKVWKKEQEALAEKKQVEELRKQYEEARQREEVEAMAVAAGVKKKQERLDWMYQGGMVAKQEAEKRADAQMLGEKEVDLPAAEEPAQVQPVAQLPSFYTQDTPASANEMWQKLHGDPMFAIKQQELMARKKIVANPVKMDAIKKKLQEKTAVKAARRAAKAEAKAAKKAAKKAKKDKKRKKADPSSSSDSDSAASQDDRSAKRAKLSNGQAGRNERAPSLGRQERNRGEVCHSRHEREHHQTRDRGRERDSHHHSEQIEPRRDRNSDTGHRSWHRGRSKEREGRRHAAQGGRRASSPEQGASDPAESRRRVTVYRDAASAQSRDLKYGLNSATNDDAQEDRSDYSSRDAKRRETQKRLEEARLRREAEEQEKANQRYKRKEHKPGQLSEEEKARRLAEMSGDADAHEEARWARLQVARKRDDSQAEQEAQALKQKADASAQAGTHHQDTAKFLQQATNQAFSGEHASLADRIGRRKYYNDRSRDESQGAFRRS